MHEVLDPDHLWTVYHLFIIFENLLVLVMGPDHLLVGQVF